MKKNSLIGVFILAVIILLIMINSSPQSKANDDKYNNFEQLSQHEEEDEDYQISFEERDSDVLMIAIHGGGIEAGTTELAQYIANENGFSYYSFEGIKAKGNAELHITSTAFDEPQALKLTENSEMTVSFHGYDNKEEKHTYIGGRDENLLEEIEKELKDAGFSVSEAPKHMDGKEADNIANRNANEKGVQLEISTAQRQAFFEANDLQASNRDNKSEEFFDYVAAIQKALIE